MACAIHISLFCPVDLPGIRSSLEPAVVVGDGENPGDDQEYGYQVVQDGRGEKHDDSEGDTDNAEDQGARCQEPYPEQQQVSADEVIENGGKDEDHDAEKDRQDAGKPAAAQYPPHAGDDDQDPDDVVEDLRDSEDDDAEEDG